jgi:hypothetical protein
MKRPIILATFTLLAILLLGPSSLLTGWSFAQQIPGNGFSVLLCKLPSGGCVGELCVTIVSDTVDESNDIGEAVVKITHGTTSSTHTVTYEDLNEDGILDCGDMIISVS